jgi:hypothetical protein
MMIIFILTLIINYGKQHFNLRMKKKNKLREWKSYFQFCRSNLIYDQGDYGIYFQNTYPFPIQNQKLKYYVGRPQYHS